MRNREEIEKYVTKNVNEYPYILDEDTLNKLILEVLLDIRDLLSEKKKKKEA